MFCPVCLLTPGLVTGECPDNMSCYVSSVSIETRHNVATNNKQGQVPPPPVWSLPPTCALREANTIVTFKVVDLMPRCHSLQWKCLSKLHSDVVYVFMVA